MKNIYLNYPITVQGGIAGAMNGSFRTQVLDELLMDKAGYNLMPAYELLDKIEEAYGEPLDCVYYEELGEIIVKDPFAAGEMPWMSLGRLAYLVMNGEYPEDGVRVILDKQTLEAKPQVAITERYTYEPSPQNNAAGGSDAPRTVRYQLPLPLIDEETHKISTLRVRVRVDDSDNDEATRDLDADIRRTSDALYGALYGLTAAGMTQYAKEHGEEITAGLKRLAAADLGRAKLMAEHAKLQEMLFAVNDKLRDLEESTSSAKDQIFPD